MIAFEHHKDGYCHTVPTHKCSCSYCTNLHYGLNIPKRWREWNSWYVLKIWSRMYIRWTNPWMKVFS